MFRSSRWRQHVSVESGDLTKGRAAPQALGLAVLMAKAGLQVPATPPVRLPPFSAVLADIGDEQSLSASLSTFSGHLRRIQVCEECMSLPVYIVSALCACTLHV